MSLSLYKCCICLNTVTTPIVMCHNTHIGCFDCICSQIEKTEISEKLCAICRQSMRLRFDRLIHETAATFHKIKKRKQSISKYQVFVALLELNNKSKYKTFTKLFYIFSKSINTQEKIDQLYKDITIIQESKRASKRLVDNNLLLRRNMSI